MESHTRAEIPAGPHGFAPGPSPQSDPNEATEENAVELVNLVLVKRVLHRLTYNVLQEIRARGVANLFEPLRGYHDFKKSRLKPGKLEQFLDPFDLTPRQVQIEFAVVPTDLSHQIHLHREAYALATPLGKREGLPDPRKAYFYLSSRGEHWHPLSAGLELDVPPGVRHGFALAPGGICYFLTIQSPPTDREDRDDFVNCQGPVFKPGR